MNEARSSVRRHRLPTREHNMRKRPAHLRAVFAGATFVAAWSIASPAVAQRGDMNCDGRLSAADVPLFVEALVNPGTFAGCDLNRADMNADSVIDGLDIQPFVAALLAPQCPGGLTMCFGTC